MTSAAIVCTKCGAASAAPHSQCAKCGGKNARACGDCGFHNSLAKNYCDKCGSAISKLGASADAKPPAAGPEAPKSDIPATAVRNVAKDSSAPSALPAAKMKAAEPGEVMGSVPGSGPGAQPNARHQSPDSYFASVSNEPWAAVAPPPTAEKPKAPQWLGTLRRALTAAFVTAALLGALVANWHWNEKNKPENAVHRAAAAYLEALRVRNYAAAYAQFSDTAKKYCTLDEFLASRDTSTWTWSGIRIEHAEPGAILLAYELGIEGAPPRTDRILFVEENKKWVRPYSWALMRKVEEAFDKGDADGGLVLAQAATTVNPRDPMARGYLCEAAYYRKSPGDSERQCLTAIELSHVYPSNLSLKSLYHLYAILADTYKNGLQKPELALDQYAQMLAFPNISPADQCEILLARSEAYIALSRPGEALADADRADQLCVSPQDLAYIEHIRLKLNAPHQ